MVHRDLNGSRIGADVLGSWQNPHIGSLACGIRSVIVEETKGRL